MTRTTDTRNLITNDRIAALLAPEHAVLVGASDRSRFSANLVRNLTAAGMADRLTLVNRKGEPAHGRQTVTSIRGIDRPADFAFLMVPQASVLDSLSEAADIGVRNVAVLSSGYAETGPEGREHQDALRDHAERLGLLVLGPNHLGYASFSDGVPMTAIPDLPDLPGSVALLSQSGASAGAMMDFATQSGVGLSRLVTLGNEAMLTAGRMLDFLVEDDATRSVAIFLETVRDPAVFAAAARRAAAAGKPVVVLKVGRSEQAARAAAAHTGALVGDDDATTAAFRELGVIRVDSIEDLILTAGAGAVLGRLERPGIGVISISGGACDVAADVADSAGAQLVELQPATRAVLAEVLPSFGTAHNPLDVTGSALVDPSIFTRSIAGMSRDPGIGVVAVVNAVPRHDEGVPNIRQHIYDAIGAGIAAASVPVVYVSQTLQPIDDYARRIAAQSGIPVILPGLTHSLHVLARLATWSEHLQARMGRPDPDAPASGDPAPASTAPVTRELPTQGGDLSEVESRALLSSFGVPFASGLVVHSADAAIAAARDIGGPVAVKLVSPDILHKSDVGGVRLNVVGDDAVAAAFGAVVAAGGAVPDARIEGVLVSPMVTADHELLVGVLRDPQWGLVLAVAIGGVFVEVLDDAALALVPVTPERAVTMLRELKGFALLTGARGRPAADLDAVAAVIARLSEAAHALGDRLQAMEINPLSVSGSNVVALDAVVTLGPAGPSGQNGPGEGRELR